MFTFVHPALLWGLAAVALPVLIHLINVLRHRRVRWAAMEFLVASQRRNRKSVLLKQLLLLLLRMAAVAAAVLMVAQPQLSGDLGGWLGTSRTHHVVLLDDSFSMSDRVADEGAFDRARSAVQQIVAAAEREASPQSLTLMRFSRARRGGRTEPDWLDEPLPVGFSVHVAARLSSLAVSETAVGPRAAFEALEALPARAAGEQRIVYLVSDYRAAQWDEPAELRKALLRVAESGARIHLVNCVDAAHDNLAVAALAPAAQGVRAAGVPTIMEVAVTNFGAAAARRVGLLVQQDGAAQLPVEIEEVPPGKTVARRFAALFETAGEHELSVQLDTDPVAADNARYAIVDVASEIPVLLVDGEPAASDARFVQAALAPAGKVRTGLSPQIEAPRYLGTQPLERFGAIYLLNVARLDEAEIAAVEKYVRAGGGLAVFLGERSVPAFVNEQLYRDGEGLFPAPIAEPTELLVDRLEKTPDVDVTDHPIFAVFAGERNSLIGTVNVERFFPVRRDWSRAADSSVQVIARLRNRSPLAIERPFGAGRVVAFLTKASPAPVPPAGAWNNWGRDNPSYVVTLLELEAYLSAGRSQSPTHLVDDPLEVRFATADYAPQVRFVPPPSKSGGTVPVDAQPTGNESLAALAETEVSGVYRAQLTSAAGEVETRLLAVNVAADEGNLARLDGPQLAARLSGLDYEYHDWATLSFRPRSEAGVNLGQTVLYVLLGVLLVEQLLAFACTYHPRRAAEVSP